jgi:DNA invertase Pin-like site-specific DNA recombinase
MNETNPEKRLLGYARVSTYGQTLDSQLEQLRAIKLPQDLPRKSQIRSHGSTGASFSKSNYSLPSPSATW